jgi:hypothetical protein
LITISGFSPSGARGEIAAITAGPEQRQGRPRIARLLLHRLRDRCGLGATRAGVRGQGEGGGEDIVLGRRRVVAETDGVGVEMAAVVVAEIQADDSGVLIGGDVEVELRRRQRRPSR